MISPASHLPGKDIAGKSVSRKAVGKHFFPLISPSSRLAGKDSPEEQLMLKSFQGKRIIYYSCEESLKKFTRSGEMRLKVKYL